MSDREEKSRSKRLNVIIRLSALGDLVLTTGFLEKLRKINPIDDIIFVSSPEFHELVRDSFPGRCRFLPVSRSRFGIFAYFFRGIQSFRQAQMLKPEAIELFDLHNVPKSRLWVLGFRAAALWESVPIRISLIKKYRFLRWRLLKFKTPRDSPFFVYKESQNLLAGTDVFLPKLINAATKDSKFSILMALDAQHWKKIWPRDHWIQLISLLHNSNLKDIKITLVGKETSVPGHIPQSLLASKKLIIENLVGKTLIKDLPTLARQHHVTVCGNTAWQHISESVGTPVISFLGPLDSGFGFSPFLAESLELSRDLPCRPCTLHGDGACKLSGDDFHACMQQILPQQVLSRLLLLGANFK
jgi:ADP-heptose:LPS heptosyltransferase